MKTRRTPWWQYVIGAVLGLLAGIGLASYCLLYTSDAADE